MLRPALNAGPFLEEKSTTSVSLLNPFYPLPLTEVKQLTVVYL